MIGGNIKLIPGDGDGTSGADGSVIVDGNISASGNIIIDSLGAGTDNRVVVYDSDNKLKHDTIDSKVWNGNLIWNGMDFNSNAVASGMYIYVLQSNSISVSKKMILMK